ncbi:MAG: hypothetical protein H6Q12_1638, partial [Bacteroidetes bacterium]|nr:hypothetical protein [Bacteroidota bacterium]
KGAITQQLKNDDELVKAIDLLNNPEKYNGLLSPVKGKQEQKTTAEAK